MSTIIVAAVRSNPNTLALSALIAIGLALTHLFSGKLRFTPIPRSRWLSAAGGVSVAYVFVHILPELDRHQAVLEQVKTGVISYLEHHVYLIALLGLTVFYGLERIANLSRQRRKGDVTSPGVFWLHIKEELPEERESDFWAFAVGAGIYTAILLAL